MLSGRSTQPCRIKATCRICQTIGPELFQSPKVVCLGLGPGTGHWHITLQAAACVLAAENDLDANSAKQRARKAKEQGD